MKNNIKINLFLAITVAVTTWVNHYVQLSSSDPLIILLIYSVVLIALLLLIREKKWVLLTPMVYLMIEAIVFNLIGFNNLNLASEAQTFVAVVSDLMDFVGRLLPIYYIYTLINKNYKILNKEETNIEQKK